MRGATRPHHEVSRNVTTAATPGDGQISGAGPPSADQPASSGYGTNRLQRSAAWARTSSAMWSSSTLRSTCRDERRDRLHLGLAHAGGGDRRGPETQPARDERLLRVVGDRVLVAGDPGAVERLLGDLAGHAEGPEVDEHQVVVGAARDDAEALGGERRRPARRRCARSAPRSRGTRARSASGTPPPWPRSRASAARPAARGTPPCRSRRRTRPRHMIAPARGPRRVLCVVVVTTSA